MRNLKSTILPFALMGGLSACNYSDSNTDSMGSQELDTRWAVVSEANRVVATQLSGDVNDDVLADMNAKLAALKKQCDSVPALQNPPCHDDMERLRIMANTMAMNASMKHNYPNPTFPMRIPDHVSPEMREVLTDWVPYWQKSTHKFPAVEDKEAWDFRIIYADWLEVLVKESQQWLVDLNVSATEEYYGGVRSMVLMPSENRHPDKVLIHLHGGAFYGSIPDILYERTAPLANEMGIKIISVDYKLMPGSPDENWDILDQRDQAIAVWEDVIGKHNYKPENVGIYGCSAGSGLTAMTTNELSKRGGPLPGAAVLQGTMLDFTLDGDTYTTLRYQDPRTNVDHLIETIWPMLSITAEKAADPRYSSLLDDYEDRAMPPTMVQAGTKEVFMSDAVRYYDKFRQAGHVTELDLYDGMTHCFQGYYQSPEAKVAVQRVAEWFEKHLGNKS
jgi:monoterpene epsilon-lactone hydrolase